MFLPQQHNDFHSGIDKLSIRDIMKVYDQPADDERYVQNFSHQNMRKNNNPQLYDKAIPEQLIPQSCSKFPPIHIEKEQSVIIETPEQYHWRMKKMKDNKKNKSKTKIFNRKKYCQQVQGITFSVPNKQIINNSVPNQLYQQKINQNIPELPHKGINLLSKNKQQVNSRVQKSFGSLIKPTIQPHSQQVDARIHQSFGSLISPNIQPPNQFIDQKFQQSFGSLMPQNIQSPNQQMYHQPQNKTLFTNNQFKKALLSNIQNHNRTSLSGIQNKSHSIIQKPFNSSNNNNHKEERTTIFTKYNPLITTMPVQSNEYNQQSLNRNEVQSDYVKKENSFSVSNTIHKQSQLQNNELPNSPFTLLSKQQEQMDYKYRSPLIIKLQNIPQRVDTIQQKLKQHDQAIATLQKSYGSLNKKQIIEKKVFQPSIINNPHVARSASNYQHNNNTESMNQNKNKLSNIIKNKPMMHQNFQSKGEKNNTSYYSSYEDLIRQRQQRMERLSSENSRLLLSVSEAEQAQRNTSMALPELYHAQSSQILGANQLKQFHSRDPQLFPEEPITKRSQEGRVKYFILSSSEERNMNKKAPPTKDQQKSEQKIIPQQKNPNLSPFTMDPMKII